MFRPKNKKPRPDRNRAKCAHFANHLFTISINMCPFTVDCRRPLLSFRGRDSEVIFARGDGIGSHPLRLSVPVTARLLSSSSSLLCSIIYRRREFVKCFFTERQNEANSTPAKHGRACVRRLPFRSPRCYPLSSSSLPSVVFFSTRALGRGVTAMLSGRTL